MRKLVSVLLSFTLVAAPWLEAAAQVVKSAPLPVEGALPDAIPTAAPLETGSLSAPMESLSAPLDASAPIATLSSLAAPQASSARLPAQAPAALSPISRSESVQRGLQAGRQGLSAASDEGKPRTTEADVSEGEAKFDLVRRRAPSLNLPDPAEEAEPLAVGLAKQGPAPKTKAAAKASPEKVILVTGFEPFGDHSKNASEHIAAALDGRVLPSGKGSFRIVGRSLPVSFEAAGKALAEAVRELEPTAVLMFGISGRTKSIEVESAAKNKQHSPDSPDADGARPVDSPVIPGGAAGFASNAPVKSIVEHLRSKGVAAEVSADAGSFVCNSAFYSALYGASVSAARRLTAFVHLPPATEHLTDQQKGGTNHWPLAKLENAASLISERLAEAAAKKAPKIEPLAATKAAPAVAAPAVKAPVSRKVVLTAAGIALFGAAAIAGVRYELLHGLALSFWPKVAAYALPGAVVAASGASIALKPDWKKYAAVGLAGALVLSTFAVTTLIKAHGFFSWYGLGAGLATTLISMNAMKSIELLTGRSMQMQRGSAGKVVAAKGEPSQHLLLDGVFGAAALLAALTGGWQGLAASAAISLGEKVMLSRLKKRKSPIPESVSPDPLADVRTKLNADAVEALRVEFEKDSVARDANIVAVWSQADAKGPYFEVRVLDASKDKISRISPNVKGVPIKVVAVAAVRETSPAGTAATLVQTVVDVAQNATAAKPAGPDAALEAARTMLYLVAGGSADSGRAGLSKLTVQQRIEYFRSVEFKDWVAAEKAAGKRVFWLKDIDGTQSTGDVFTYFLDWRARNRKLTLAQGDEIRTYLKGSGKLTADELDAVEAAGASRSAMIALDLWKQGRISSMDLFMGVYWPSQKGMTREEKRSQAAAFVPEYRSRIFPDTAADNLALHEAGVEVVFVTHGDAEVVSEAGPELGNVARNVIGTRLQYGDDGRAVGRPNKTEVYDTAKPQKAKALEFRDWLGQNTIDPAKVVVAGIDGDSAAADGGAMLYLEPVIGGFMVATPGGKPERIEAFKTLADKFGAAGSGSFITLLPRASEKGPLP